MDASISHSSRLKLISVKRGLPAATVPRSFAEDGGLMSYSADVPDSFRRAAAFVVKKDRQSARPRPPGRLRGYVSAWSVCSLETPPHYANFLKRMVALFCRFLLPLPALRRFVR